MQLSAWRANVDMQYMVSRRRVIEYCTKYVTKSEPHSQSLKEIFTTIVRSNSLKAVQKLLVNSVGERDYSTQGTCHLLLQLQMFKSSRDFIVLSLDRSRAVEDQLQEEQHDHYMQRPYFNDITLLEFARQYSMPKTRGSQPTRRSRRIVVIPRPYCSPDPAGPKYEQYCRQLLMQHRCSTRWTIFLLAVKAMLTHMLHSGIIPPCLEDDVYRLLQHTLQDAEESSDTEVCFYEFIPTPKLFSHCLTYTCAYPYTGAG